MHPARPIFDGRGHTRRELPVPNAGLGPLGTSTLNGLLRRLHFRQCCSSRSTGSARRATAGITSSAGTIRLGGKRTDNTAAVHLCEGLHPVRFNMVGSERATACATTPTTVDDRDRLTTPANLRHKERRLPPGQRSEVSTATWVAMPARQRKWSCGAGIVLAIRVSRPRRESVRRYEYSGGTTFAASAKVGTGGARS